MGKKSKLQALAKKHKAIARKRRILFCVDCKSTVELESDHILSKRWHAELMYKLYNLCIRCKDCNLRKGVKFYFEWRTFKVIFISALRASLVPFVLTSLLLIVLHYLACGAYISTAALDHLSLFYLRIFCILKTVLERIYITL